MNYASFGRNGRNCQERPTCRSARSIEQGGPHKHQSEPRAKPVAIDARLPKGAWSQGRTRAWLHQSALLLSCPPRHPPRRPTLLGRNAWNPVEIPPCTTVASRPREWWRPARLARTPPAVENNYPSKTRIGFFRQKICVATTVFANPFRWT